MSVFMAAPEGGGAVPMWEVETSQQAVDLLAFAPGGVAKLRCFILSLAVRGRLTHAMSDDEDVSELLRRISVRNLLAARSSSKMHSAPAVAILNDGLPFRLPHTWRWVRLGDITTYGSCEKAKALADETWVLDLEDIEKDTGFIRQRKTFAERRSQSDKNVFLSGDVLYGKLRPYLNKVAVADCGGVCTTEIIPFRSCDDISPHYMKVALQSPYFIDYVNSKSYGMKMPRLGTEDARAAPIPLPPLAEQRRIVASVEELMMLCDALEQTGRLADEQRARLTSALFDALASSESAHALAENWARVAEYFDVLLDRPEAIDALEQMILRLAVRGLLVPQDSNDEPAGVLVSSIRAAKNRLITEGKIRPDKFLAKVDDADRPYDLPASWAWARFGSISVNRDGERVPVSSDDRQQRAKLYDYYGASGVIDQIDGYLFDKTLLLVGEDGANLINRSTPIAYLASGKYWVNNHAHVVDVTHSGLMEYLCLFIKEPSKNKLNT